MGVVVAAVAVVDQGWPTPAEPSTTPIASGVRPAANSVRITTHESRTLAGITTATWRVYSEAPRPSIERLTAISMAQDMVSPMS